MLKPQDTLIALKLWADAQQDRSPSVRDAAGAIGISASEFSKGLARLEAAHLVVNRSGKRFAEKGALLEWLSYGVRYALAADQTGYGRGMATAWNCTLIKSDIVPPTPATVWLVPGGNIEGAGLVPFHQAVPLAASQDDLLYLVLALVDVVRIGKPRELAIARNLLTDVIRGNYERVPTEYLST